jgi:hypothetical protein
MHYKEKFSAYINHELPKEERQEIAEHILVCEECRTEHDQVKLGAALAGMLRQSDAPPGTWKEIEAAIAAAAKPRVPFFNFKTFAFAFGSLAVVVGLGTLLYFALPRGDTTQIAKNDAPPFTASQQTTQSPQMAAPALPEITAINANTQPATNTANVNSAQPPAMVQGPNKPSQPQIDPGLPPASWNFETIAGMPTVGSSSDNSKLAVGDFLETDGSSKARIEVADIGNVEIEPNSRVRLVNTSKKQHRLSLERGKLQAQILAPPRLFIVDTPSAVAVDLGCAYTLEVDKAGNSKLQVTSGYVALERGGRESIVPAGAVCFTRRGQGIGTPFFESATPALEAALLRFDFDRGGSASLAKVITEARAEDTLTLWHLLPRVQKAERERLFEVLNSYVATPDGVTREGILKLDKKMLEAWRLEMEIFWFS